MQLREDETSRSLSVLYMVLSSICLPSGSILSGSLVPRTVLVQYSPRHGKHKDRYRFYRFVSTALLGLGVGGGDRRRYGSVQYSSSGTLRRRSSGEHAL